MSLSVRCPVWRLQRHHTRLPKSRARRGRLARVAGTDQASGQEKAGEPLQERPSLRFVGKCPPVATHPHAAYAGELISFCLQRRRAQNRASQRAYRERKDQRIKDLEQMLTDAKQRNDVLGQAYAELHSEYILLKTSQLKDQSGYPTEQQLAYPAMGMPTAGDGLDMDLFVYSDMQTGYTL